MVARIGKNLHQSLQFTVIRSQMLGRHVVIIGETREMMEMSSCVTLCKLESHTIV